eukprot:CAMPEP_0170502726 /NCGR_PEP_ID=MMETSP0208-20121228/42408_1 /TAXON_ID=197538 /ORGANISM="Strombidium inclinatum, Strain S3" /LENGTH=34 /DNA_ID= /DNA_START= /DNA_END= /DNA_ORIENTATION=
MSILSEGSQFKKLNFFWAQIHHVQEKAGKDVMDD